MHAQELARWAIRIAVACYLLRVTLRLRFSSPTPSILSLVLWITGCIAYLIHVLLAFHAFHGWSHDAAVQFTADETERVVGVHRGEGVWVNYVFAFIWVADCIRLARSHLRKTTTLKQIDAFVDVFFALMMFSATVIFGPHYYRVLAVPIIAFWLWLWSRRTD